jgi:peptide/nickel transport system ATP-binding protein
MSGTGDAADTGAVLALRDVVKEYGQWGRHGGKGVVRAVDGVSLEVARGQALGIVGESGSGKSTLARMVVGLLAPSAGEIRIDGRPLASLRRDELFRRVQMVFQDPFGSLNPRKTVRQILDAPLVALGRMGAGERADRVDELMQLVRLRPEFVDRHPHEFSGGQCQRIGIARALAIAPEIVVLDEPVSALDVSVQAQVLSLLLDLKARLNLTYVFISHDLAVVEVIADKVAVMKSGKVVELAGASEIFSAPRHDYTRELISSIPGVTLSALR